ncbi:MAG: LPS export ABC transporter periplasmic protein LptC [Hyphomicrobiales bacterium]|nr:LPS export ABC transporter periplasmic protein LptC [Hyphomicrobiales bacterium]
MSISQAAAYSGQPHRISIRSRAEQAAAFAAARTHSRLVRRLKRAIVAGSGLCLAAAIGYIVFDPFSKLPKDVSISKATFNGTKITMEHPRLSGFRKDGRPYLLLARSGVQDVRQPKIIELNEIDATIKVSDKDTIRVSAPAGVFDSSADRMRLSRSGSDSRIRFRGSSYLLQLDSADINFKSGLVVSDDPVSVKMSSGTIHAKGMRVEDNGKRIIFLGNVRSVINGRNDSTAVAPGPDTPQQTAGPATNKEQ